VVREDPARAGLLYAGTEFGMYVSFDNGAHWQSLQLNLPNTPVTDMKFAGDDLVLSTQGRGFWILDNLTPLHQVNERTLSAAGTLFAPRDAIRTPARGGGRGALIQYPFAGAQIDYYLNAAPPGDLVMEIVDPAGKVVRKFTSSTGTAPGAPAADSDGAAGGGGEDAGEGGFRVRSGPTRLDKTPGMHRFTWDLRYPGPWMSATRPEGPNGPMEVPGRYSVRLTAETFTSTQQFNVVEDPRVTKAGVTLDQLREQFDHNMRVLALVNDVNHAVAQVRAAQTAMRGNPAEAAKLARLNALAARLITPPIRYSKPELQTHITYLYSLTNATDQRVGQDAIDRYAELRKELDDRLAELHAIIGQ
jgi:hypothetical protein